MKYLAPTFVLAFFLLAWLWLQRGDDDAILETVAEEDVDVVAAQPKRSAPGTMPPLESIAVESSKTPEQTPPKEIDASIVATLDDLQRGARGAAPVFEICFPSLSQKKGCLPTRAPGPHFRLIVSRYERLGEGIEELESIYPIYEVLDDAGQLTNVSVREVEREVRVVGEPRILRHGVKASYLQLVIAIELLGLPEKGEESRLSLTAQVLELPLATLPFTVVDASVPALKLTFDSAGFLLLKVESADPNFQGLAWAELHWEKPNGESTEVLAMEPREAEAPVDDARAPGEFRIWKRIWAVPLTQFGQGHLTVRSATRDGRELPEQKMRAVWGF